MVALHGTFIAECSASSGHAGCSHKDSTRALGIYGKMIIMLTTIMVSESVGCDFLVATGGKSFSTGGHGKVGKGDDTATEVREHLEIPSKSILHSLAASNTDNDYSDHHGSTGESKPVPKCPVSTI